MREKIGFGVRFFVDYANEWRFSKKYWKERPFLRYQHSFRNATRGAKILVICFYLATAFFLLESLD